MQKTTAFGIEWTYRPGLAYAGTYRGWQINIRYAPPMDWMRKSGPNRTWRLSVRRSGGGSISFDHQFYATVAKARLDACERLFMTLAEIAEDRAFRREPSIYVACGLLKGPGKRPRPGV